MAKLRNLLDEASLRDEYAVDPLAVVAAGRRRVRQRGLVHGAALVLVLVVSATAVTLRPWETGETRGPEPVAPVDPSLTPRPDKTGAPATVPGTRLRIGETAIVPVQHLRAGEVGLTVTAVRQGNRNDILSIPDLSPSLRSSASRGEFWYVDVTITYLSGRIGGYYLDPDVAPALHRGKQIGNWIVTDHAFSPCPSRGLPRSPGVGETVDDCVIFQTQPGTDVVGLNWGPSGTSYDVADGKPVTWR